MTVRQMKAPTRKVRVRGYINQARDFLPAQHHGELARLVHGIHFRERLGTLQGHGEEKPQCGDRAVERRTGAAMLNQVQLVAAQILRRGGIGRAAEEAGEVDHREDIMALGLVREFAHPHVIEHALA